MQAELNSTTVQRERIAERYADVQQLIDNIRAGNDHFAEWLVENHEYSRWSVMAYRKWFYQLDRQKQLTPIIRTWFYDQLDSCKDSI